VSARHGNEQATTDYWTRRHTEHVVLDIGGDFGALVIYTAPELNGRELEISPLGRDTQRVHTAVLERVVDGRSVFAAVYPSLRAGVYRLWGEDDATLVKHVHIEAGRAVEVEFRRAARPPLPADRRLRPPTEAP
jgi:hypothetical protein